MTVGLAELLAQAQDRLIQDWASDLHRQFGSVAQGAPDFSGLGRIMVSDLIHYLRRGDPGALRDLAVRTLEGQMHAPSALYRASRRLSAAMDLILVEVARQSERPQGRLDLAPSEAEEVSQHLDREIRRALRFQRPLSLLLVEVDRYDEYMRLYGAALGELAASA